MGNIFTWANLPVPLCMVSSASGSTDEPVRMNCDGSPRRSTSLRMQSHIGGNACHSSIRRGVSPSSNAFGLSSIICELCINTAESPRSSMLLASCLAVVVLPHHLGPSIRTAPLPRTLRFKILSAIRGLYVAIFHWFYVAVRLESLFTGSAKRDLYARPTANHLAAQLWDSKDTGRCSPKGGLFY